MNTGVWYISHKCGKMDGMGLKEGEVDPTASFQEAIEHAKEVFERAKQDDMGPEFDPAKPLPKLGPSDTQEIPPFYSAVKGAWKAAGPVIAGALTVGSIAVLDWVLATDYLSSKLSPVAVIGVTAAARFVQNYLKQVKKANSQDQKE